MNSLQHRNLFVDIHTMGIELENQAVPMTVAMLLDNGAPTDPVVSLLLTMDFPQDQWRKAAYLGLGDNLVGGEDLPSERLSIQQTKQVICDWILIYDIDRENTVYVCHHPMSSLCFLRSFMENEMYWLAFPGIFPPAVDVVEMCKLLAHFDPTIRFDN